MASKEQRQGDENEAKEKFRKNFGGEGQRAEKKEDKDSKNGMRSRKMQGSLFNEPKLHPSFTFKLIV